MAAMCGDAIFGVFSLARAELIAAPDGIVFFFEESEPTQSPAQSEEKSGDKKRGEEGSLLVRQ